MNKKQKQVNLGTTIFSSIITLAIGIFLGANWNNLYLQFSPYINPAQKVTSNIKWDDLNEVYSQISSNFDGSIDKTNLIEGAKKGLTAALADPYTVYYDSKEAAEFKSDLKGEIKEAGVGIEMMKQGDYVVVTRTLPNNPARKAGVHAGDIIFAINGEEVWDKVREELAELETELKREDTERSTKELGDFLFSLINAARLYNINPDNALELTNQKFIARFGYIEAQAKAAGKDIKQLTLEEMDKLWNEAKQNENQ